MMSCGLMFWGCAGLSWLLPSSQLVWASNHAGESTANKTTPAQRLSVLCIVNILRVLKTLDADGGLELLIRVRLPSRHWPGGQKVFRLACSLRRQDAQLRPNSHCLYKHFTRCRSVCSAYSANGRPRPAALHLRGHDGPQAYSPACPPPSPTPRHL